MTDVATVTNQLTAKYAAGAKGAAASAGSATMLDGSFAALLGAAEQISIDGEAVTDGKTAQPMVEPVLTAGDPARATSLIEGVGTESGEAEPLPGHIAPVTGKPRKASRGKDAAKGDDALPQTQVAMAAALATQVQPVSCDQPKGPAKAGPDGAAAIAATVPNNAAAVTRAVTTDVATAVQALIAKDGKGDKPARESVKAAPAIETAAAIARDQGPAPAVSTHIDARRQDDQLGDNHGDRREGSADKGLDKTPVVTLAASDDSTPVAADPLRDIVQSLPPVVQTQLGSIASASAAPAASTGDLLSSHAIDMSISGQWIDRMAREIATVADGSGNARFQLSPPNLGRIQIDLLQADDRTNVRILAETDEAARRLREGQGALEAHARASSFSFGSVSVEKSSAPLDSSDRQNQRQSADPNSNSNQQNFAQAQGQSAQGRNNSGGNLNRGGFSAVMGHERQGEPEQGTRTIRASDPRVRFA
ncbi:MAG: flagellar hook-length control protein FliK [Sphingobium sp.]|nr:flagellar hook-length control protein FliK [Sphingobium sp.]